MINFFVTHHGPYFYERDIESMSNYPPQYGMAASNSKSEIDYERLKKETPTENQIILSV